jgi:hypothetical protein
MVFCQLHHHQTSIGWEKKPEQQINRNAQLLDNVENAFLVAVMFNIPNYEKVAGPGCASMLLTTAQTALKIYSL